MDATQNPFKFVVEPAEGVAQAGTVTVSWSEVPSPSSSAWIGLYANSGAPETSYLTYKYITPTPSGSLSFTMPETVSSTYEFRFFANGGYTRIATTKSVSVNPPPPVKLTVEPKEVGPEGTVTVSYSDAVRASTGGWIGLYANGSAADNAYLTYKYLGTTSSSGSLSFTMPEAASSTYEFRIFPTGAYDNRKVVSSAVTVSPPPPVTLVAEPKTTAPGGVVNVSWTNARKPSTSGWIGLYASASVADNAYVTYKYITAGESGSLSFNMPAGVGETYEFRFFPSGGYDKKATSAPVIVVEPVAELKKQLAQRERELAERDQRIAELEAALKKCGACEAKLAAQEQTIAALNEELKQAQAREAQHAEQTRRLRELESELKTYVGTKEKLAEQERVLAAMAEELKKCAACDEKLRKAERTIAELEDRARACADCEAERERLQKLVAILEQKGSPTEKKADKKKPDDLKVVEGIGPKITELLGAGGIQTFKQLAEAEVSRIKELLSHGGPRFSMADPSSWPAQAKLAAEGRWDDLNAFQAKLRAGRNS